MGGWLGGRVASLLASPIHYSRFLVFLVCPLVLGGGFVVCVCVFVVVGEVVGFVAFLLGSMF